MPDQGTRESRVHGEGRQEDGSTGQSAHDVQLLKPKRLSLLESCGVVKATCPVWGRVVGKGPAMEPRWRPILRPARFGAGERP